MLHRNIYVKRYAGAGGARAHVVFDPGAKADVPMLRDALNQIAGGVQNVDLVFISHQDPDVTSNVRFLAVNAPRAMVICSVDAWRLVNLLGVSDRQFYLIENWESDAFLVKATGHKFVTVPAHYCHFRGSAMVYDPESRVLFSGDVFAGIDTRKGKGIYANEASWEGISLFHQIYMPSRKAVHETVTRIRALKPRPAVIAPQHGDVIRGALVPEFMARLEALDVGMDLVRKDDPEKALGLAALNVFFADFRAALPGDFESFWAALRSPQDFTMPFRIVDHKIEDMSVSVRSAVAFVSNLFNGTVAPNHRDKAMLMLAVALESRGVPVPAYCLQGLGRPDPTADESPLAQFLKQTTKPSKT